jgi:hypothetical protein
MDDLLKHIPEPLQEKFEKLYAGIDQIIERGKEIQKTSLSGLISFKYESSVPRDILTEYERAQSVCFVTRYESLPVINDLSIAEHGDKYYLNNIDYIRHILNEYRAIIQNQSDSVYYQKIHRFCREKLINRDKSKDLVITINHKTDGDITMVFIKYLDEQCKSIRVILDSCDYGYIYNGILQHSDHSLTKRFLEEYSDGIINYVFIKHAVLLGYIKERLYWHYKLLNALTFPKLGSL